MRITMQDLAGLREHAEISPRRCTCGIRTRTDALLTAHIARFPMMVVRA
ncbi:MAG: hypothetical protein O2956_15035 [Gemmatimonadetes bacterium]|nr:hypothetical protein [Gemmatimonadota bacterium]